MPFDGEAGTETGRPESTCDGTVLACRRPTPSVAEPFTGFASGLSPVVTTTVVIFGTELRCAACDDAAIGLTLVEFEPF